ncbi:hypothetical protein VNO77_19243 [Canavalia gladiata]|uniref:Secreted protein n=1 Tax=Canavalia gladiata TaxID=3824 RepID=A0AAN9LR00_CANGL
MNHIPYLLVLLSIHDSWLTVMRISVCPRGTSGETMYPLEKKSFRHALPFQTGQPEMKAASQARSYNDSGMCCDRPGLIILGSKNGSSRSCLALYGGVVKLKNVQRFSFDRNGPQCEGDEISKKLPSRSSQRDQFPPSFLNHAAFSPFLRRALAPTLAFQLN